MADAETSVEQTANSTEKATDNAESVADVAAPTGEAKASGGPVADANAKEQEAPPTGSDENSAKAGDAEVTAGLAPESEGGDSKNAAVSSGVAISTSVFSRQFAPASGKIALVSEGADLKLVVDEDEEYAAAAAKLQECSIVKTRRQGLLRTSVCAACFTAKELVKWLVSSNTAENHQAAVELCKKWVGLCLICPTGHGPLRFNPEGRELWRFVDSGSDAACIDGGFPASCRVISAMDIALVQERLLRALFDKYLSGEGQQISVNYRGIETSAEFGLFKQSAAYMKRVDFASDNALTRSQHVAFFINLYNILCIASLIASGAQSSLLARVSFFKKTTCVIGGQTVSLDEIENGILRANRKGPSSLKKPFSDADSRLPLALSSHEPRIHFALVCGARSCPPLRAFSLEHIEEELNKAAEDFLGSDRVRFVPAENRIYLSKIMSWFGADFGSSTKERLQYYCDHMPADSKQEALRNAIDSGASLKVSFTTYDWSLNDNGDGVGPVKQKKMSRRKSLRAAAGMAIAADPAQSAGAGTPVVAAVPESGEGGAPAASEPAEKPADEKAVEGDHPVAKPAEEAPAAAESGQGGSSEGATAPESAEKRADDKAPEGDQPAAEEKAPESKAEEVAPAAAESGEAVSSTDATAAKPANVSETAPESEPAVATPEGDTLAVTSTDAEAAKETPAVDQSAESEKAGGEEAATANEPAADTSTDQPAANDSAGVPAAGASTEQPASDAAESALADGSTGEQQS